jgi:hypothetical protein
MYKYGDKDEHIPFKFKANLTIVDILRSTKTIIKNSGSYNSYMTKY